MKLFFILCFRQQQVDLSFYGASSNKTHIDLGNIPLPIQTNISGQVVSAISPVNLGAFSNLQDIIQTLPITGAIMNITKSNTSYIELSTHNITNPSTLLDHPEDIVNLPIHASLASGNPLIPESLDRAIENLAK